MSENCTHDCGSCGEDCSERNPESFIEKPHELSKIKKIIGVISGKGGVGKSLVTAMLSVISQRNGYSTAILDADVTGPSIPKMFGIDKKAKNTELGLIPAQSSSGIDVMSINLLLANPEDPVIWRGPIIAGVVKQFWTDVIWKDIDYMFIDMPPGTGDVPLTVFQSIPIDGVIIVSSPQELVSLIVRKAVNMANMMNIPILGVVENMSYIKCPDCGKEINIFGDSNIKENAAELGIELIGKLPIEPKLTRLCDEGRIEFFEGNWLDKAVDYLPEI